MGSENNPQTTQLLFERERETKLFFLSLHLFFFAQSKSPQSSWQKNAKLSNDCATANPEQKDRDHIGGIQKLRRQEGRGVSVKCLLVNKS